MNLNYEILLNAIRQKSAEWTQLLNKAVDDRNFTLVSAVIADIESFNRPTVAVSEDENLEGT